MSEPIYLVIERTPDGAVAVICYDLLSPRLRGKGAPIVYALRLDRLDPKHRDFWLNKSAVELLDTYRWLRDEGTLPPPNLADPPKKSEGPSGRLMGPEHWWRPPATPWEQS